MQAKSSASRKAHEIRNPAIAFGVYGSGSKRIGDIAVTCKGLVWSNGTAKDVLVKWDAFIGWMEQQLPAAANKKAKAAAPKTKAPASGTDVKTSKSGAASAKANGAKRAPRARKAPAKAAPSSATVN